MSRLVRRLLSNQAPTNRFRPVQIRAPTIRALTTRAPKTRPQHQSRQRHCSCSISHRSFATESTRWWQCSSHSLCFKGADVYRPPPGSAPPVTKSGTNSSQFSRKHRTSRPTSGSSTSGPWSNSSIVCQRSTWKSFQPRASRHISGASTSSFSCRMFRYTNSAPFWSCLKNGFRTRSWSDG